MSHSAVPDFSPDDSGDGGEKAQPHHFDGVEWEAFKAHIEGDRANRIGPDSEFACNVTPTADHLHMRRVGDKGGRGNARGVLMMHNGDGDAVVAYFTASELRQIAATALNIADEIDGETPLFVLSRGGEDSP